mmetsp:Transcript_83248/g.147436  ORF Transcript_83248/g.147436 Transcript_83248/m.147436 type:complete len:1026 (+) Transcript_83248:124-3201(+)
MSAAMDASGDSIYDLLTTVSVELSFAIFFGLGFLLVRSELFGGRKKVKVSRKLEVVQNPLHKTIEAEVAAGHMIAAVKAWRGAKARTPTRLETLKLVVQAFLEVEPSALVNEITGHIRAYRDELCNSRTAAAVLDVLARNGQVALMEEVRKVLDDDLQIYPTVQIYEALLGGYASAGDEKQVEDVLSKLCTGRMKVSARGYALTIKGFLKNGKVDAAMEQMKAMHRAALTVPSLAVTQLVRASCEAGRGMEIFNIIQGEFSLPPEATTLLLEDCLKRTDLSQARQIEQLACKQAGASALSQGAYDALLKTCVAHGDSYALELFERMQTSKVHISERLCVALLSRCAETKFLRFAEEIVKFIRGRNEMTMAAYSALMKVYAYSGMYDKACDLYDQIIAQGMEPDNVMYGCLMKFAVECGRTDLSRDLFSKVPTFDIQHYMSLIRAAGRDKNIDRAFQVLQKLKESGVTADLAVYNCVLDVCVSAGDMSRARELIAEMRTISKLDMIAYNTFLKGFCGVGDIHGAKELLLEMESAGMPPNDVSYNCMINAAVSKGLWQEAWSTVDMMERSGVKVDHYTVSILMKALKKSKDSRNVGRALALLDHSGLDPCSDEVMLQTLLETCIRHREHFRLQSITKSFEKSSLQPSVFTYGSLIKACSILKRVDKCWELWSKMADERAMEPNDIVLGCMLDALVCNDHVEEALSLFKKYQEKVRPNTIIYSTLMKGFANSRQASRAMDMWREMRESGMSMNTVVYNGVIDAQARLGLMDEVSLLVQTMEKDGCEPDPITYSTIVKGYCVSGMLDKAFDVFRSMQQNQMANDSIVYNTLLDGCVRQNRMDLADLLLEDMDTFNITPSNFTLGNMVKMWGRRKRLDKAFEIIEEIPKKHGFKANAQAKTCLMFACLNNHDVDAALRVFEGLRSSDKGADWKTYASIIGGTVRHGCVEQAVALVEDAYGLNGEAKVKAVSPGHGLDTDCLEQLLHSLVQKGQMKSLGLPLLNKLRAAHVPISAKLLSTFASGPDSAAQR